MEFKHLLYWSAIGCAVAQILMSLYARFYGDVAAQIQTAALLSPDSEMAVVKVMNYALPIGVGCILMLLYTWKSNQVGGVAMVFAIGMQLAALDLNLRAVRYVFGEETALSSVAWWAPAEKPAVESGQL